MVDIWTGGSLAPGGVYSPTHICLLPILTIYPAHTRSSLYHNLYVTPFLFTIDSCNPSLTHRTDCLDSNPDTLSISFSLLAVFVLNSLNFQFLATRGGLSRHVACAIQIFHSCIMLCTRFNMCSTAVKFVLFKTYCLCFYNVALWRNYTVIFLNRFKVSYHRCVK